MASEAARDRGQRRVLPDQPQREGDVLAQGVELPDAPAPAAVVLDDVHPAELEPGPPVRFPRRQAARQVLLGGAFEMEAQLVVEIVLGGVPAEQRAQAEAQVVQHRRVSLPGIEHVADRRRQRTPRLDVGVELPAPLRRQRVVLRPPVVLGLLSKCKTRVAGTSRDRPAPRARSGSGSGRACRTKRWEGDAQRLRTGGLGDRCVVVLRGAARIGDRRTRPGRGRLLLLRRSAVARTRR